MELYLKRYTYADTYTLGNITFDNYDISIPTVEDKVRQDGEKVYGETAIPAGRYKVLLDVVSPKFSKYPFYMEVCEGKLPRLQDVPGFSGILLHCGINEENSLGCPILNNRNAPLEKSKEYFIQMMDILKSVPDKNDVWINIS